ncbi:hypothetical protein VOLCADRAFT_90096 [Volvox carteri f. nagariensis]|uniref:Carbohydrate kinase PfkB domain-containing protein n=1 Tax=Volvox carteri f. nagariensis TaxID=3068 RepID=D8TTG8_VOLCA|nr:uncharacterized protein VOLCADRAFT_90096 [Volvox carteri f. nagariensis]EFJ49304.1 hypothetical protein VOLCADRAFT_90096 [Volvox carteri f. nagariensis]|eukprot:XP_002949752.1 hypothetical protein VOLCADRAFT_90096 [Volvox carteri f. nagariensis]
MADGRLAVLLAHLAPEQQGTASQPGSRVETPWFAASSGPLVIVGGVCLDIQAQPNSVDVQRGTSVPGQIRQVPGGVGRNMAEALSGLVPLDRPAPVFVSLVGDDTAGSFLTTFLRRLRLDLSQLITLPGATTPCVSAMLDRGGEVAACVADVTAVERHLTPERLRECQPQIQQACMLLAEGNLSAEALEYISRTAALARVPVFLEPVSVPKATRLVSALPYATFVSPNAAELISMADEGAPGGRHGGRSGFGGGGGDGRVVLEPVAELLRQLAAFAEVLLLQGTSCVVLTLGSLGAALITLAANEAAAGAGPRSTLEPLDACSTSVPAVGANYNVSCSGGNNNSSCCWTSNAHADVRATRRPDGGVLPAPVAMSASPHAAAIRAARGATASWALPVPRGDVIRGALLARHVSSAPVLLSVPASTLSSSASPAAAAVTLEAAAEVAAGGLAAGRQTAVQQSQRYAVQVVHLRALPAEVVSVNGAGDTLVAGMVAALLQQQDPVHALAYGMAAAKRAVESHRNVPDLEYGSLRQDAETVVSTMQHHFFPSSLAGSPAAS